MAHSPTPVPNSPRPKKKRAAEIPPLLVYEWWDGKPLPYQGFAEVVQGHKTTGEVMGQSDLQFLIVTVLTNFLYQHLDRSRYLAGSNETGLHLAKTSNVSSDIVIYDKLLLQKHTFKGEYFQFPPLAIMEVDVQADTAQLGMSQIDYYSHKTQRLLDFGVKEVFWFFTGPRKVLVARPGEDWRTSDWTRELLLLNEYPFCLHDLLQQDGWQLG